MRGSSIPRKEKTLSFSLTGKPYYLSIDTDYWTNSTVPKFVWELGKFLIDRPRDIPITAVMNHQQLLWNVNRTHVQRLVNLDFHSDLQTRHIEELHCGSWVSYVQWRRWGEYIWVRPEQDPSLGACSEAHVWDRGTDWKRTMSIVRDPERLNLRSLYRNCMGIGLCMSPAFINETMQMAFVLLITDNKIPYREGDWGEHNMICKRPPGYQPSSTSNDGRGARELTR